MQRTYLNGIDIRVETFDVTQVDSNATKKIDVLFYNTISRYGEILSSMVYNSGTKDADDTSVIIYNPNRLLRNNEFELGYTLGGTASNLWKNNDLVLTGKTNLRDNSLGAVYTYPHLTTSGYSVAYVNGEHSYDGWYTLASVVLPTVTPPLVSGAFRVTGEVAEYYNGSTWLALNNIPSQTVRIYNFLGDSSREVYMSYDFVSTVKIDSLYRRLLDEKFDKAWFKKINILAPKMSTLKHAIEFKQYDVAQHIINAVDNSLLSLLI
jgi:hypothetical protein